MKKNNHKEIFLRGSYPVFVKALVMSCMALMLVIFPTFAQEQKKSTLKLMMLPSHLS